MHLHSRSEYFNEIHLSRLYAIIRIERKKNALLFVIVVSLFEEGKIEIWLHFKWKSKKNNQRDPVDENDTSKYACCGVKQKKEKKDKLLHFNGHNIKCNWAHDID